MWGPFCDSENTPGTMTCFHYANSNQLQIAVSFHSKQIPFSVVSLVEGRSWTCSFLLEDKEGTVVVTVGSQRVVKEVSFTASKFLFVLKMFCSFKKKQQIQSILVGYGAVTPC
jgi:hypothetical protein